MKRVLIGHRGSGKTSLLRRHQNYFPVIKHFDLDQELQIKYQSTVQDFFKSDGEQKFREAELATYNEITKKNSSYVISLGAGFNTAHIHATDEIIFVSRNTDSEGRIFLDRPRLDENLRPLAEYQNRYNQRNLLFREKADFIYHLPEGLLEPQQTEKMLLKYEFEIKDAYYTLSFKELTHVSRLMKIFKKIELRTDLLTQEDILELLKKYPEHHWMVSFRTADFFEVAEEEVDVDIQFYKNQKCSIISTHEDHIDLALDQVQKYEQKFHIKLSPRIESFSELIKGYDWQQKNPSQRSFLPRSLNGKWNWYRHLSKYQQKINFLRNFNEQADQPSIFQWLNLPLQKPDHWAAVLGKPIFFSRSPIQHQDFFNQRKSFMCEIEIDPDELKKNLAWLLMIGLKYAAVTSPLKEVAFDLGRYTTEKAQKFRSANTLLLKDNKLFAHNTDVDGFTKFVVDIKNRQNEIAVWGGGGTLSMIRSVLPQATYFSSQTGLEREIHQANRKDFKILIWAAPRLPDTLYPPTHWPLEIIYDINYVENSMGLEFAQKLKSNRTNMIYKSGLEMFFEQARKQQEFWSSE